MDFFTFRGTVLDTMEGGQTTVLGRLQLVSY